ncbi:MAG: S-layer homology domain-containing protein [Bacillota bacterium]
MRRSIIWLLVLLLLLPVNALAAEVPALPHCFYGSLTVFNADGTQSVGAPAGTAVSAKVSGSDTVQDTLVTAEEGRYGGPAATDPKLLVGKKESVEPGTKIFFYANGVQANEESSFVSGAVTELALTVKDETGPSFRDFSPTGSITDRKPVIGATVVDDLAGVDPETMLVSFTVDGSSVTPQISDTGRVEYVPGTALSLGAHTVGITARDRLGYQGSVTWSFTIVSAGGGGGGGGGGAPAVTPTPAILPPTETSADVYAETGGTIILPTPLGDAKVEIPAGALPADTTVTIRALDTNESAALTTGLKLMLAGQVFEITATGVTGFNSPITITLPYDVNAVDPGEVPSIYYYDQSSGTWVNLGGTINNGSISISVDHLTKFAVFTQRLELKDITKHWARQNIEYLVSRGIIKGYPDNTFKPERNITRLEFAVILARAANLPTEANPVLNFTDSGKIPTWAKERLAAAVKAGLIKGYPVAGGGVAFRPDRFVTRTEIAAMVTRVLKSGEGTAPLEFTDAGSIPPWARASVAQAVTQGIVSGYPDRSFRPNNPTTRAEAAVMIYRLLQKTGTSS